MSYHAALVIIPAAQQSTAKTLATQLDTTGDGQAFDAGLTAYPGPADAPATHYAAGLQGLDDAKLAAVAAAVATVPGAQIYEAPPADWPAWLGSQGLQARQD